MLNSQHFLIFSVEFVVICFSHFLKNLFIDYWQAQPSSCLYEAEVEDNWKCHAHSETSRPAEGTAVQTVILF